MDPQQNPMQPQVPPTPAPVMGSPMGGAPIAPSPTPEKKSFGPLIGIIVIIIVIIVGGLYFWSTMSGNKAPAPATETSTTTAASATAIDNIQADLNAPASDTPADFSDIESQLNQ